MWVSSVQIHQENWWKNYRTHYVVSHSPSCGSCSEYMMALGKGSTDSSRSTTFSLVVIFFLLLTAFPSTPATTKKIKCGHKQGSRKGWGRWGLFQFSWDRGQLGLLILTMKISFWQTHKQGFTWDLLACKQGTTQTMIVFVSSKSPSRVRYRGRWIKRISVCGHTYSWRHGKLSLFGEGTTGKSIVVTTSCTRVTWKWLRQQIAPKVHSSWCYQNKKSFIRIFYFYLSSLTTLQSMMNAKLSKQRFWHCHENGLIKTIQTIPHNL